MRVVVRVIVAGVLLAWCQSAQAGNDLYFVTYNHHVEKGETDVQPHYLSPILMFHPSKHLMVHIGAAFGLTGVSDDLVRTGIALEL